MNESGRAGAMPQGIDFFKFKDEWGDPVIVELSDDRKSLCVTIESYGEKAAAVLSPAMASRLSAHMIAFADTAEKKGE